MPLCKPELDDLVYEYLITSLQSLRVMAELFADPTYLRKYPPQQLAILHASIADKVAQIIEVMNDSPGDYVAATTPQKWTPHVLSDTSCTVEG